MKAISIHPEPAMQILAGSKKEEYRSMRTHFRGDLLICSTATKGKKGKSLCVVELFDCEEVEFEFEDGTVKDGFAWHIRNVRPVVQVEITGKQGFWNFTGEVKFINGKK